jgi:hypothetical protein
MIAAALDLDNRPFPRLAADAGPGAPPSPEFLALSALAFRWATAEDAATLHRYGSDAGLDADRRARAAQVEFHRAAAEVPERDRDAAWRLADATRERINAGLADSVLDLRRAVGYAEMPGGFPDHMAAAAKEVAR